MTTKSGTAIEKSRRILVSTFLAKRVTNECVSFLPVAELFGERHVQY
jgi:hypothetical protein